METLRSEQHWPAGSHTLTTTDDIARELRVTIPDSFLCPITLEIMRYPVRSRTGFDFERSAILKWISKENCCPLTRRPLRVSDLIPNHQLDEQIAQWAYYNCLPAPRKYYCSVDDNDKYNNVYFLSKMDPPPNPTITPPPEQQQAHLPLSHRLLTSPASFLKTVTCHHHSTRNS